MSEGYILTSYHGYTTDDKTSGEDTSISNSHVYYDSISEVSLWRSVFAEFLGLTLLVLISAGASAPWDEPNAPTVFQIAIASGLTIATLIHNFMAVSGAHVNPAVTIAFIVSRKISFLRGLLYVLFQCAGACLGAEILKAVTPDEIYDKANGTFGCTLLADEVSLGQGFLLEFMITFQLLLTIFAASDEGRTDMKGSMPLTVGLSVICGVIFGLSYTGGSMNPARSFGTAVIAGCWKDHWIYWLAPILGGIVGGVMYECGFSQARLSTRRSCMA
ncbi:aquaporin AQPAn.G-like [Antedon mediterranea]|uniref:aquaporin AQPAn.G-like n=1 Tax=Antedon mediterranea TaxID=105859 RepID=UPI003AF806B5